MAITVTEAAVKEIKRVMEEQDYDNSMFFRIGLGAGGCSGFSYKLVFDDNFDEDGDKKYDFHGLEVVVDKKSAIYLDGATMDWYEGIDKRGFTFDNPNAVKSCGCGSSFGV